MKRALLLTGILMLAALSSGWAQQKKVSGKVVDPDGNPVPAATIVISGTTTGTTADANGNFVITANVGDSLDVSSIGYTEKTVVVPSGSEPLTISLNQNANILNETVVTALGISREERKVGYAVSTIEGSDIVKTSPTNFASALYGKAPGVAINTNPGGATSAVSVQIRGLSSITNPRQPLLVVDGIVVRNGEANNNGYWGGPRIEGNGILDINPANIKSISILKGAAAAALYGSDAANGVIVVTTKSGRKQKGLGVDFSASASVVTVGILPEVQKEFGPGYDHFTNEGSFGTDPVGFIHDTIDRKAVVYPRWNSWGQFGPKIDGRDVYFWDGKIRPYTAHDNWKNFYRTGSSLIENIALSNATEKLNYRFSYTRNDYKGIEVGSKQEKNTFNLNITYHVTPKLSANVVASYINERVHNRPWQISRVTENYTGFVSAANSMELFKEKYKTSKGYKYVTPENLERDPEEALKLNTTGYDYMDFFWRQLINSYDETTNRLIASTTLNYDILDNLHFRGRIGTDYTGYFSEEKDHSEYPIAFGTSGAYATHSNRYNFTYGDLLLTYDQKITDQFNLSLSAGYQARKEEYRYSNISTSGGLTKENWFSISASKDPLTGASTRQFLVKDGLFGILDLSYGDFLFIEATGRQERSSTLYPGNNSFFYPGVSGSFELSNAFDLPQFVTYSKLRASWAIVGNPGVPYQANVVYNAYSINGTPTLTPPNPYGNESLKNEKKHEVEFGWETKLFNARFGFDISYYHNIIEDQILNLEIPASTGVTGIIVNVGTLQNNGLEIGLDGTPVRTANFQWDAHLNLAMNHNKVLKLMKGLDRLVQSNIDNGSLLIVSEVGKPAGDIIGYKLKHDAGGTLLVDSNGYYIPDFDHQVKLGNIQAKFVGGFINNLRYKGFNLNIVTDFRWGGQVISQAYIYGMGAGLYKETLYGRDAEHGGLPYYVANSGQDDQKLVQVAAGTKAGPNGETIYHDGIILDGVTASGKPNATLVDAPTYYLNSFSWGEYPGSGYTGTYNAGVFDNNYIKLRELSLSYTFPVNISSRLKINNLTLTLYGRNLFYFYKSLPYFDPEASIGTNYLNQASRVGGTVASTRSYGASIRLSF